MANSDEVINFLRKKVEQKKAEVLNLFTDEATKLAQRNFDNFVGVASTDYPFINVKSSSLEKNGDIYSRKIYCKGNQVAFIEFGVGRAHYNTFLQLSINEDIAPRPAHLKIGSWGKHQGLNDYWIRPSSDGIPRNIYEMPVAIKDKQGNTIGMRRDVVWTEGHRPARALWRAIKTIEKRFLRGKYRR